MPRGKYDIGHFGRYGQPLSPFTAFALSTYQLPGDLDKRDRNCKINAAPDQVPEASENDCEDVEE